jgi:hypothetical protein
MNSFTELATAALAAGDATFAEAMRRFAVCFGDVEEENAAQEGLTAIEAGLQGDHNA